MAQIWLIIWCWLLWYFIASCVSKILKIMCRFVPALFTFSRRITLKIFAWATTLKMNKIARSMFKIVVTNKYIVTTKFSNLQYSGSSSELVKGLWLCLWELWHSVIHGVLITECHNSHQHSQSPLTTSEYSDDDCRLKYLVVTIYLLVTTILKNTLKWNRKTVGQSKKMVSFGSFFFSFVNFVIAYIKKSESYNNWLVNWIDI